MENIVALIADSCQLKRAKKQKALKTTDQLLLPLIRSCSAGLLEETVSRVHALLNSNFETGCKTEAIFSSEADIVLLDLTELTMILSYLERMLLSHQNLGKYPEFNLCRRLLKRMLI